MVNEWSTTALRLTAERYHSSTLFMTMLSRFRHDVAVKNIGIGSALHVFHAVPGSLFASQKHLGAVRSTCSFALSYHTTRSGCSDPGRCCFVCALAQHSMPDMGQRVGLYVRDSCRHVMSVR